MTEFMRHSESIALNRSYSREENNEFILGFY